MQTSTRTSPPGGADALRGMYRQLLADARERTLMLVDGLSDDDLHTQFTRLLSPLVWDIGHIAAFEDLWLCQRAGGLAPLRPELAEVYDASETPRARRSELPFLGADDAREYMDAVRERALSVLDSADLSPSGDALNAGGLVWEMLVQHEQQHNETMLQALKLAPAGTFAPERLPLPPLPAVEPGDLVRVPAGPFVMGFASAGFAYDNERPAHEVHVDAFEIDRTAVTNAEYARFVEDGGYDRRELWSEDGWAWRLAERVERPLYWTADGRERSFERTEPIRPDRPVMHVSWFEADAFARWRGMRLPTEAEWEKAAQGSDPAEANLDQLGFGPAAVAGYPRGASAHGALGMLGDCWEWTATAFTGYPGFRAYPYPEYSEVFFGDEYRVLRGGSWATRRRVARTTFRNWDFPQRRQIFAGFRCARDA